MGDAGARSVGLFDAMRAARAAQAAWAGVSVRERAGRGRTLSRLITERADDLAAVISDSMGKTRVDAMSTEVVPGALAASYYARIAPRMLAPRRLRRSSLLFLNKVSTLTRVPFGVIAVISPWNYPFGIPLHEIVPALLAGNAVLFKPASQTAAVGEAIVDLVHDAGFPEGLLQLVRLPGASATDALLEVGIDKMFFTGSTLTGAAIMAKAAARLVPVVLELGGSDAMIVLNDANLERAAAGALWAGMSNAGQSCAGVQRVFVEDAVWREFVELLRRKTEHLRVGPGTGFDIDVGAMAAARQKESVEAALRAAEDRGACVVAQSGRSTGLVHPVVILETEGGALEAMREEVFGPVIALSRVRGEEEAVERANDSPYGLTASVWSRDRARARRVAERLRVGAVTINDHLMSHGMAETPWGGFGRSGIGRSHGEIGFDEMTQPRVIVDDRLHRAPRAMWWYPYDRSLYEGLKGALVALYGRGPARRIRGGVRLAPGIHEELSLGEEKEMKYRSLGRSGLIVSEVALGTMQFGKNKLGNLDQEATTTMVKLALDRGINFIDTADVYTRGESETLLGNALKGVREEIVLASKVRLPMSDNFNRAGATRVNMMRGIETSLKRLQTDHLDLYQVHSWDSSTPLEETLRTFDDLVRQGKVRYVGFSNCMAWQGAAAIDMQERLGLEKYVTAQMYYSLVGRGLEHEFLDFAEAYGIGILVWSPLAGGFLSGKYERGKPAPKGTRYDEAGAFLPLDMEQAYRVIDVLKKIARKHGASPARVALAWLLSRPAITSVIIAARTNEHLEDNIKAVDLVLPAEDIGELNAVSDTGVPYPRWMVLQHDTVEDPRKKVLHPELYEHGGPWQDLSRPWKG